MAFNVSRLTSVLTTRSPPRLLKRRRSQASTTLRSPSPKMPPVATMTALTRPSVVTSTSSTSPSLSFVVLTTSAPINCAPFTSAVPVPGIGTIVSDFVLLPAVGLLASCAIATSGKANSNATAETAARLRLMASLSHPFHQHCI